MIRKIGLGILFLVCAAAYASPAVESEIKARNEEFVNAWNRHDTKGMAALWAPDGDLINPFGRHAKGAAEVEKLFHDEHTGALRKSTYKTVGSSIRPLSADMALVDWDVELSGIMSPDGKAMPPSKPHVTVLMKKANGKWWIVAGRAFDFGSMPPMPAKK